MNRYSTVKTYLNQKNKYFENTCALHRDNRVFDGFSQNETSLAVAYGNVRTFKLLCRLHHDEQHPYHDSLRIPMYADSLSDKDPSFPFAYTEKQVEQICVSFAGNHLSNRCTDAVTLRAQNQFHFYKQLVASVKALA